MMKNLFLVLFRVCLVVSFMAGLCAADRTDRAKAFAKKPPFTKTGAFVLAHPDSSTKKTSLLGVDFDHRLPPSDSEELADLSTHDLNQALATFLIGIFAALAFPRTSNACTHCVLCLRSIFGSHCCSPSSPPPPPPNNGRLEAWSEKSDSSNIDAGQSPEFARDHQCETTDERGQVCLFQKSAAMVPNLGSSAEDCCSLSELAFTMELDNEGGFVPSPVALLKPSTSLTLESFTAYEDCLEMFCSGPTVPRPGNLTGLNEDVSKAQAGTKCRSNRDGFRECCEVDDCSFTNVTMAGCTPAA